MGKLLKSLAILSILAFFFCAGWVVVTADGVAFRYFLISALIFVFSVFGGFSYVVWREMRKRNDAAVIERIRDQLTKQNLN